MSAPSYLTDRRIGKLAHKVTKATLLLQEIDQELQQLRKSLQPSIEDMDDAEDRADIFASAREEARLNIIHRGEPS